VKLFRDCFLTLILVYLTQFCLAEDIVFVSSNRVYVVDLTYKELQVIVEPSSGHKIGSILVLPRTRQLVYVLKSKTDKEQNAALWQCDLKGAHQKSLLQTDFSQIELCDFSPDEQRIVFQGKSADSFTVGYLNLKSGKYLSLNQSYSPRFLTNTKILVLAAPSQTGLCYHLLARWNVAQHSLDTLSYSDEICNRIVNLSPQRNLLAVTRSDANTQMNEFIDVLDTAAQMKISKAAQSFGLIRILGGPDFSPDGKYLAWVSEHWLHLTDLKIKESKIVAERLMTDDIAWSPYGGEIAFAFIPPKKPKECQTCPKSVLKKAPGIFIVNQTGDTFERVTYSRGVDGRIFWIK